MSVDSGGEGVLGVPGEAYAASVTPYRLALRRLRHNYKATVFASLFILVVVLCLLAPVYARYVAHTGPNVEHITEVLDINGKSVDVVSPTGVPVGRRGTAGSSSALTRMGVTSPCASYTAAGPRSLSGSWPRPSPLSSPPRSA